jgi:D-glycero-D-manno-heptose 1,7-bisphosphate phosphatase
MMRPVVLCRDGVINRIPKGCVRSPDDWHALPGSLRAIARMTFSHFNIIVVTNQPDIGEGGLDSGTLARIHAKMKSEAAREGGRIDAVLYCPHRVDEDCPCHMPRPGLLLELGRRLDFALHEVPFITHLRDNARMALALGMQPMLVDPDCARRQETHAMDDIPVFPDLAGAADAVIRWSAVA